MGDFEKNISPTLAKSFTVIKFGGFWCPENFGIRSRIAYYTYTFSMFMCILGSYMICQSVSLYLIWGNLPLMTSIACVLLTDAVQVLKISNLLLRRQRICDLVRNMESAMMVHSGVEAECVVASNERELRRLAMVYIGLTAITILGWANIGEQGQLPIVAWYPYDTKTSPAYELTYIHQIGSIVLSASIHIAQDVVAVGLVSLARCRLQLVQVQLRNLMDGLVVDPKTSLLFPSQEDIALKRLRSCVACHQMALKAASEIQACFSFPILAQFSVSLFIICVTAFQLATTHNTVVFMSMFSYLLNMVYQVFIYCYQGNEIREQSSLVMDAAYACPWYESREVRRRMLPLMLRARRQFVMHAGRMSTVTLQTFMAIVKTSYSLFTLLKEVNDRV